VLSRFPAEAAVDCGDVCPASQHGVALEIATRRIAEVANFIDS
jgi:hypothetical protein